MPAQGLPDLNGFAGTRAFPLSAPAYMVGLVLDDERRGASFVLFHHLLLPVIVCSPCVSPPSLRASSESPPRILKQGGLVPGAGTEWDGARKVKKLSVPCPEIRSKWCERTRVPKHPPGTCFEITRICPLRFFLPEHSH